MRSSRLRGVGPRAVRSESGAVIAEVLYALALFCVLSLTAVGNVPLERTFRTSQHPDLHLVLYAGGAGSSSVLARLNLPTVLRGEGAGEEDKSVAIKVPSTLGLALNTALPPGGTHAVQLADGVRVCCDGGDNACARVPSDQQLEQAALTPALAASVRTTETQRELTFKLETFEPADSIALDPNAAVDNGFLVKASRLLPDGMGSAQLPAGAGSYVVCRLEAGDGMLASGLLQLDAPVDSVTQTSRLRGGSVYLKYRAPAPGDDSAAPRQPQQ